MVTIGSARINEKGQISGGQPGDQTSNEVSTQPYYNHPKGWLVFRANSIFVRELLADAMAVACSNQNIGYCQEHNQSLTNLASRVDYDLSKIDSPCETDCAQLVRCCILYTGIHIGFFYTATEPYALSETGQFTRMDIKDSEELARGDVLVTKTKGHTAIVLNSGSKYQLTNKEMQESLRLLGWYTGVVGNGYSGEVVRAVRNYQKGWNGDLEVDGIFGPKTSLKLVEDLTFYYKGLRNKKVPFTKDQWLKELDKVAKQAFNVDPNGSKGLNLYGDNHCFPIGRTQTWSCDRLGANAAYNLGYTNQRHDVGGSFGLTVRDYKTLVDKGVAIRIEQKEDLKAGDAVIISDPSDPDYHVFFMASDYGPTISKWDFGSDTRIETLQPVNSEFIEPFWKSKGRKFAYGIRWLYKDGPVVSVNLVKKGQAESIKFTGVPISVDGIRGAETNRQMVRCLQHGANLDWNSKLSEDGILGPKTREAFQGHYIKEGETQYVVTAVQIIAYCKGLDPNGVEYRGHYGSGLRKALKTSILFGQEILALVE